MMTAGMGQCPIESPRNISDEIGKIFNDLMEATDVAISIANKLRGARPTVPSASDKKVICLVDSIDVTREVANDLRSLLHEINNLI